METALYIVSSPIGNLRDITLRALDVLKEINFIACEDTRVTSFLLNKYEIKKELISFNAVSEIKKIDYVLNRIEAGESCALLSDAGTPGISDPGTRLISAAIERGVKVIPVPGASALTAALTLSGFPTDSFLFEGFPPQKKGRQKFLKELSQIDKTIILYESTYRIEKLLKEIAEYMPGRRITVCRELTKMFEEVWRGTAAELLNGFNEKVNKGEFVVVIAPLHFK
jgi:16S rRNA (cytidine1402-2'-O)-methyltransferase